MWQAPSQRVRALANARKRDRERARRPFHMKRVIARLKLIPTFISTNPAFENPVVTVDARLVLNDIQDGSMVCFSQTKLHVGQKIAITLEEPSQITIQGKVAWCDTYHANSHVLTQSAFSFRTGVKFVFENAEDEAAFKNFHSMITREHVVNTSAA